MLESIKKAFVLSVKALKLFYVIAAFGIIANVINLLIVPAPVNVEMTLGRSFLVIGITILFSLIGLFIACGALAYVKELVKAGSANLASFIDNGKKYFLRLLGITILIMLIFSILGILFFLIVGILPNALRPLMIIIMVVIFLALGVLLLMPSYALVGSELGVIESIKKGITVGKNNFLKILGILAIMFLVAIGVTAVASVITGILSLIVRPISGYVAAIIMAIANAVMAILVNVTFMDFYLKSS